MQKKWLVALVLAVLLLAAAGNITSWKNATQMIQVSNAVQTEETEQTEKKIALTFDDGPGKYTEQLLDGLKEADVKATFFLLGINAESNREIVKRIADEGHLIGNHTYDHVQLTKLSLQEAKLELRKNSDLLYQITGKSILYMRPPYGEWSDALAENCDMTRVMWSIDPVDWSVQNTSQVAAHILSHAEDGSIILLHDIFRTSVEAALQVIAPLKEAGFTFVTIDEMGPNSKIFTDS